VIYHSDVKVKFYHFYPEEVYALYRLIRYHLGYLPSDDPEITEVMKHVCKIVDIQNELATKYHQTA
jgi:hypothetical protein